MTKRGARQGEGELTPVGETALMKKLVREYSPTRARLQFVEAAVEIGENPDKAEAAYLARQLVICTLPHANPGDLPIFTRRSGAVTLTLVPYIDKKTGKSIGFPYGSIPRLLLFWLTTEAIRTKSRRLELGRSLSEFMRTIGLNPETGGGKRGDAKRLAEQSRRLFRSTISFEIAEEDNDTAHEAWEDMQVAPRGEFWWAPKAPAQGALWGSWIELGESFYEAITSAPVPFDMRALRALKRSPLALDLYAWACYSAFSIVTKKAPPRFVSWSRLMKQFGTGYTNPKEFQRKAHTALKKIALIYPGLEIKPQPGGFSIHASRLAIAQRPSLEGAGKGETPRLKNGTK